MNLTDIISRFGVSDRASLAVRHDTAATGYFVVTPKAPYDGTLTIGELECPHRVVQFEC